MMFELVDFRKMYFTLDKAKGLCLQRD